MWSRALASSCWGCTANSERAAPPCPGLTGAKVAAAPACSAGTTYQHLQGQDVAATKHTAGVMCCIMSAAGNAVCQHLDLHGSSACPAQAPQLPMRGHPGHLHERFSSMAQQRRMLAHHPWLIKPAQPRPAGAPQQRRVQDHACAKPWAVPAGDSALQLLAQQQQPRPPTCTVTPPPALQQRRPAPTPQQLLHRLHLLGQCPPAGCVGLAGASISSPCCDRACLPNSAGRTGSRADLLTVPGG